MPDIVWNWISILLTPPRGSNTNNSYRSLQNTSQPLQGSHPACTHKDMFFSKKHLACHPKARTVYGYNSKHGYRSMIPNKDLKNPIGKRKNKPKPVVPVGLCFLTHGRHHGTTFSKHPGPTSMDRLAAVGDRLSADR